MENEDILDLDFTDIKKSYEQASKGKRFVHLLVDGFIFGVVNNIVSEILTPIFINSYDPYDPNFDSGFVLGATLVSLVITILVNVYGYTLLEFNLKGKSIAKYITNTRVVSEDYTEATFQQIHIRSWCRIIPFEAFSFLGSKPTGWHDSISKTIVIDETKKL